MRAAASCPNRCDQRLDADDLQTRVRLQANTEKAISAVLGSGLPSIDQSKIALDLWVVWISRRGCKEMFTRPRELASQKVVVAQIVE